MKLQTKVPGMTLYPGIGKHWWENATPAEIKQIARETERLGFDQVSISEHIVMDTDSVRELGPRWVHSLSAAGMVLGATETIRVVPLIVVPYHHPVELAKALGTLDFLSGGRVVPLMMVGYNRHEFGVMNAPYEERGAVTDEYIDACIELWSSDTPTFAGRWVSFSDIVCEPRPARQPMEMWFGGRRKAALRRIARVGDGWIAYATPRARFRELCDYIREQPEFQARPRELTLAIELFEGRRDPITHVVLEQAKVSLEPEVILGQMQELADLGANQVDVSDVIGMGKFQNDLPGAPPKNRSAAEHVERLQWFAEEVMPEARRITPRVAV